MTETPEFARTEDVLPGLEAPSPSESRLKLAARRSIVALEASGYLDERHAVVTALILDLADRVAGAKDYAAANLSAQLLAAYQLLVPESRGGDGNSALDELVAELRARPAEACDSADAWTPE